MRIISLSTMLAFAALLALAAVASGATGGPDAKGYRWDDAAGPPFATIIPATPSPTDTLFIDADEDAPAIDISYLGFDYYDTAVTTIYVNNNGFISFNAGTPTGSNQPAATMPNPINLPSNFVAGCWADYRGDDVASGSPNPGIVYKKQEATRFIVEWNGYRHQADTNTATFQIILNADDTIDVVIRDCQGLTAGGMQSSGTEDASGSVGLSYFYTALSKGPVSVRYYPNGVPDAANDTTTTTEDTAIDIDVLANDTEPDDDDLSISAVTAPGHGTAVVTSSKKIRYTPNADTNDDFRGGLPDTFTYTISDPYGKIDTATVSVTVTPANDAPVYTATGNVATDEDTDKTFSAWLTNVRPGPATATDEAGQTVTLTLDNVGGTNSALFTTNPALTAGPSHDLQVDVAADESGVQTWRITATDSHSTPLSTQTTFSITVNPINDAPSFTQTATPDVADPTLQEGAPLTRFSVLDPWAQSIGKGAPDEAGQAIYFTVACDDPALFKTTPSLDAQGILSVHPAAFKNGQTDCHVTIKDDAATPEDTSDDVAGNTATATISILPRNDPPVPVTDNTAYLIGQGPVEIDVVANDSSGPDPGETLRLTTNVAIVSAPAGANAARASDTHVRFDQPTGLAGLAEISYEIEDDGVTDTGSGPVVSPKTATGKLFVDVHSPATVGTPDLYGVQEDGALKVDALTGVLQNDAKVQGLTRTVLLEAGTRFGQLTLEADGSFMYVPEADYSGGDHFLYAIDFGEGLVSEPVRVDVIVNALNDQPLAFLDKYSVPPDEVTFIPIAHGVLANDHDADGDAFTARLSVVPDHGKVDLRADGAFRYTPKPGFTGLDVFFYEVEDSSGIGGRAPVHVLVVENEAPWADFTTDRPTAAASDPRPVRFIDQSVDEDGDIVAWLWDMGNGDTFDTPGVEYIFGQPGEYRVRLTVWDTARASSSLMKTFIVTKEYNAGDGGSYDGDKPKAEAGNDAVVLQGTRVQLGCRVTQTNGCKDNLAPTVLGHHWVQTGGPTVELSDPDSRYPSFTAPAVPPNGQVKLTFALTIFDGQYVSDPDEVHIYVQDRILRPVADAGNDLTAVSGKVVNLNGKAVGFDEGATLRYLWSQLDGPTDLGVGSFEGQSLSIRAPDIARTDSATAAFTFSLVVTDGVHMTAPDMVTVVVDDVPRVLGFRHDTGRGVDSLVVAFSPRQNVVPGFVSGSWDFGDGNTSTFLAPVHRYAEPGTYRVVWEVKLNDGRIQTFEKTLEVGSDLQALSNVHEESRVPVVALGTLALVGTVAAGGVYGFVRYRQARREP